MNIRLHRLNCPGPNDMAAYIDGTLKYRRLLEMEDHFSSCLSCRNALIELRKMLAATPPPIPDGLIPAAYALPTAGSLDSLTPASF